MFDGKKGQLSEFNPVALGIGGVIWLIFLVMVLKIKSWSVMPLGLRIIMIIVALPLFYIVAQMMLDNYEG